MITGLERHFQEGQKNQRSQKKLKNDDSNRDHHKGNSFTEFFRAMSPGGKGKQDKTNDRTKEHPVETVHEEEEDDEESDISDDDSISDKIEDLKELTEAHSNCFPVSLVSTNLVLHC